MKQPKSEGKRLRGMCELILLLLQQNMWRKQAKDRRSSQLKSLWWRGRQGGRGRTQGGRREGRQRPISLSLSPFDLLWDLGPWNAATRLESRVGLPASANLF